MALTLSVTDAGRAALRNPTGNGTNAVRIATVGVTSTAFVSGQPVVGEIKRIATIAGGATAADTIHVTVSDNGGDVYSVRGFGFYLDDGTLFASYSQANVIVEKSAQATMMMAVDVKFTDIDATQITFGDSNFSNPAATTDTLGVVRLASDAEAIAGADAQKALTAKNLLAALNDRLGAGAPTTFVKTLLTKASVLAFCTALGIRGAAQYDTGSGNGLDADLLDGKDGAYYLQWVNLSGVPATFTPSAHQHNAADITSGTLLVARGGTGLSTATAGSYLIGNGANAFQLKAPADVLTDIGAAAKQHSHPISDIVGLQSALDAKTTPAAVATQISSAVSGLINGAPGALDTLKELADAMGDDPNFAASVTNALAGKLSLTGGNLSGLLGISGSGIQFNSGSYWATMRADPSGITGIINKAGNAWNWQVDDNGNTTQRGGATVNGTLTASALVAAGLGTEVDLFLKYSNSPAHQVYLSNNTGGFAINYTDASGAFAGNGISMNNTNGNVNIGNLTIASRLGICGAAATVLDVYGPFGRILFHNGGSSQNNIQSVNTGNNAYTPLSFTAAGYNFNGGNITSDGAITAAGGFQLSDRRLKTNIKPRAVLRGIALKLARKFVEWDRISDGVHDVGLVAQALERIAPWYVVRGKDKRRTRAIDKAGVALECSMDNALSIEDLKKTIAAMMRRIDKLERHK